MPWDDGPNAGFTVGRPWLPLGERQAADVARQAADERSMLSLYRRLLALRRSQPALVAGEYVAVAATESVLAYERRLESRRLLVVLNMGHRAERLAGIGGPKRLLLSTALRAQGEQSGDAISLGPDEGVVLDLAGTR
jgi:alpha-glucosidase